MTQSFNISADHLGFYLEGKSFFPKIQNAPFPLHSWSDAVLLPLSASLKDDLDWSAEKITAEKITVGDKLILWEIDFQFHRNGLHPHDTSAFFAYVRALEEFVHFSSGFSKETFGVCLYRGDMHFSSLFNDHGWEERFYEWLEALLQKSSPGHELRLGFSRKEEWFNSSMGQHYFHLFSAEIFAGYLHRLISILPDGLLPFAFFDVRTADSCAYLAQLFSKERFQYLYLGMEGAKGAFNGITLQHGELSWGWLGDENCLSKENKEVPALAICLPSDPFCDRKVLAKLDSIMKSFRARGIAFRILCEEKLAEEWDGLDRLVVIEESISPQGKRKLQGFIAAGGEILYESL